ncbi:hypothetical protein ACNJFG_21115, partial [Mycobacterium tuberculosis]
GIPNVIDLQDFIEANGMDYGIDENLFFAAIENKTSILKLYFDAAYQKYVRPVEKNLNKEED